MLKKYKNIAMQKRFIWLGWRKTNQRKVRKRIAGTKRKTKNKKEDWRRNTKGPARFFVIHFKSGDYILLLKNVTTEKKNVTL